MKQPLLYLLVSTLMISISGLDALSQCNYFSELSFINPSFEGQNSPHITPLPWNTCGITPDTQPGSWGVTETASDGSTYVGLINSSPTWQEGVSVALDDPMLSGVSYGILVDLSATTASGGGINPNNFGILEVWGGDSICEKDELLWSSPLIDNLSWQTYQISFVPSQSYEFIYFLNNGEELGYLLMDNLRSVGMQSSTLEVNTLDSIVSNCQIQISGSVNQELIDSILITGDFNDSPHVVLINDSIWTASILFNQFGYQNLSVFAYSTDLNNQPTICGQVGLTVHVNGPEAAFDYSGSCSNEEFLFYDNSLGFGQNSIVGWEWDFDGLGVSLVENPSFEFDTSGVFNVALRAHSSDGCWSDTVIAIEVLQSPKANFHFTEVCLGGSTNFHDISDEGNESLNSWYWDFADGNASILEDPTHTYSDTGEYQVQLLVSDYNGCRDSIIQGVEVFLCSSVHEPNFSNPILIYPNPASSSIFIESKSMIIDEVTLYDSVGKSVYSSKQLVRESETIPIDFLTSAIYFIEIKMSNEIKIYEKILVQ